jgi:hypothetical protein
MTRFWNFLRGATEAAGWMLVGYSGLRTLEIIIRFLSH